MYSCIDDRKEDVNIFDKVKKKRFFKKMPAFKKKS